MQSSNSIFSFLTHRRIPALPDDTRVMTVEVEGERERVRAVEA